VIEITELISMSDPSLGSGPARSGSCRRKGGGEVGLELPGHLPDVVRRVGISLPVVRE
jgi:hypothetical protein